MMEKKKAGMTPEQYRTLVLNNIEQDTKLHEIYRKLNIAELQQFILGRIKTMKLEIGEAPTLTVIRNTFNLDEERELADIMRNAQSDKVLASLGPEIQNP